MVLFKNKFSAAQPVFVEQRDRGTLSRQQMGRWQAFLVQPPGSEFESYCIFIIFVLYFICILFVLLASQNTLEVMPLTHSLTQDEDEDEVIKVI